VIEGGSRYANPPYDGNAMIRTVTGDIATPGGAVLVHEHLQIDLTSRLPQIVIGPAEEADVIDDLRRAAAEHGLRMVADLSVPGSGRDAIALRRISDAAGVSVVCATGFYWDPLPAAVHAASVDELRERMIAEIESGIDGSNIRAGVIKIGTDANAPTEAFERVFRAAALAARATGTAVITHTTTPDQAEWQMDVLERCGLDPGRALISHFNSVDAARLEQVARRKVFMGIDQIGFAKGPGYAALADLVAAACARGLAGQLILSSDMARKARLHRHGGTSYSTVFTQFLPLLRERGVSAADVDKMLKHNPERLLRMAA
jgi:phosphotriesterase-related protein